MLRGTGIHSQKSTRLLCLKDAAKNTGHVARKVPEFSMLRIVSKDNSGMKQPRGQNREDNLMRTFTRQIAYAAVAVAVALISYPQTSFAVPDCSYNGAFDPPLPDANPPDGFCDANRSVRSRGSFVIPPDSPLELVGPGGVFIKISEQPPRFPVSILPGSFWVDHSVVSSVSPDASGDINIDARGDIVNDGGILSLVNVFGQVRLKAGSSIAMLGPNLGDPLLNPSSLLVAQLVNLRATKGRIELHNTSMVSYSEFLDFIAPRGSISIQNSIIFVLPDRSTERIGQCRFQPQVKNNVVIKPVIGLDDPSNTFVCLPVVIKK
jgi:hypothetical protein